MIERVQKIISASGLMSRRKAEELIQAGRVSVNGETISLGYKADSIKDLIAVDGVPLHDKEKNIYIMLNKPAGYVTTLCDEKGRKTVVSLLSNVHTRVYPVGRLDMYSEGLLVFTNDGELANRMMHPSFIIDKVYNVLVEGNELNAAISRLRNITEIDGQTIQRAGVTELDRIGSCQALLEITIHEGKNRQIRKMCDIAGLKVLLLKRVAEGPLRLGSLETGKWRYLTEFELKALNGE